MTRSRPTTPRAAVASLLWLAVYVLAVTVPLFALLPGPAAGLGFGWDFPMALGYAGLAMLGVQFALTARFRRATAPFGIDIVYYFHRYLAVFALAVIGGHYALLRVLHPEALGSANPAAAPAYMTAGRVALALFAVVVLVALARKRAQLDYDRWRFMHALLATTAFALALWHLHGAGRFLDTAWKQWLWSAYGAFWVALIAYVRLLRPLRTKQQRWTVAEVRPERGRVWTLALRPQSATPLHFAPGQFAWLTLRASPFAMREHPFSIASSAERGDRVEVSIKAAGDFTSTIKDVKVGETAWIDAPYGTFSIDDYPAARGYAFVAGGIGIAPIMSMLRTLADRGDQRPLVLFYGNRVWDRVAFREELDALAARLNLKVVHVLLEPDPNWTGERGFISEDVLARHLPPERRRLQCFLCGPTPMTTSVEQALSALGVAAAQVHSEIFDWV
ncbi:MAG: ferric reductase-like transmembrane domain-containing protein [Burkholderiaceae bacterium]